MMDLNFSYNWNNKLHCHAFTTIRLYQPEKYVVNKEVEIMLNGKSFGKAIIVAVKQFWLKDLNEFVALLDTGYPADHCAMVIKKIYPSVDFEKTLCSLILISKIGHKG